MMISLSSHFRQRALKMLIFFKSTTVFKHDEMTTRRQAFIRLSVRRLSHQMFRLRWPRQRR